MRLIGTVSSDSSHLVHEFCYFLSSQNITNECEAILSPEGDVTSYNIWIKDEDDLEKAEQLFKEFKSDPHHERYKGHVEAALKNEQAKADFNEALEVNPQESTETVNPRSRTAPYGKITSLFLFAVIVLFLWSMYGRPHYPDNLPGLPLGPNVSPIEKTLLYDYPHFFELRDEVLGYYSEEDLKNKAPPPREAQKLIREMKRSSYWNGIYQRVVDAHREQKPLNLSGPFFEKIQQGEIWRLWTPILLHFDLLHIFFNVLWFIILGNQIEYKIGSSRYFFLIVVVALLSNTAQYLMSGPIFMGLSGVVTGLAGFIWARQRVAPWEGYLVHRMTLLFLWIFVFGMMILQLVFFFLEFFGNFSMLIGIANTAHIIGAVVGYIFGRLPFYKVKSL